MKSTVTSEQTTFIVTDLEVISYRFRIQTVLHILLEKGAPIGGTFWLRVKPGFEVEEERQDWDSTTIYRFSKVTK